MTDINGQYGRFPRGKERAARDYGRLIVRSGLIVRLAKARHAWGYGHYGQCGHSVGGEKMCGRDVQVCVPDVNVRPSVSVCLLSVLGAVSAVLCPALLAASPLSLRSLLLGE